MSIMNYKGKKTFQ